MLSGNHTFYLGIFQTVKNSCRLSRNLLDCPEIFYTAQKFSNLFGTFSRLSKFSRRSGNCQDCPEIFHTVRKSSKVSSNLPDCLEHFPDCPEILYPVQKFSRLSGNLPDCLEIFQTIRKYLRYLTKDFFLK